MRPVAAALLALSTVAAGPALAQGTAPTVADGAVLEVSATGKTTRVPDIATISAGVVTQSQTAAQALSDNARNMARVLAALKAAGVQPRDIATANVSLQPQYRYESGQAPVITGYQAGNSISIRFRDIAKAGRILDILVAQGANQINGPNLSIDQPDAALDEARADAVKRARGRADLYARAAGLSVARILSISEGGESNVPPPMMYRVAAAPMAGAAADTSIAAGETDVTATVVVRFLLK
ncbi:SIMPL domain-containing protein [uncultured Sphingomonas sp.]|uniref:SIMPL domain-containing protein n=1 Tax=uncultured Sphingomonas sp. TaxID=158754 RepID=UPI0035CC1F79